ncbi:MAG TPA: metallophosphoesterase [Dysgonomonas sp.]|uniref:metallophosphoesterase family protein n=1 Tax=unclassified Dysgonomonas TaxID=2630389 RepID=UPI0025C1F2F1|nr:MULTISPECIES: metallophosphoesterase [unclassified Dysgonomonas]HML66721.1 metallophosphoesterase [Dysgonomonas sp.]
MDTIILRFRDTDRQFDTIKEHQDIIDSIGFTWWGWWKKSSEDSNEEAFKDLKEKIIKGEITQIGLFDRTENRFYIAQILDVLYDLENKIGTPDNNSTPIYYNEIKLHSWFKLCNIKSIDKKLFVERFTEIPTKSETFYALPYSEDVVSERILIKNSNILHLSDIHFGDDFGFPHTSSIKGKNLLDKLNEYFKFINKIEVGLLVISGDITSRANIGILQGPATEFLNNLCKMLKLEKDHVIIVPGNHDIPIKDANFYNYNHENAYKIFLNNFYGKEKEITGYEKYITPDGNKIDILRINSSRLRDKSEMNFGYVGWDDYRYLIEENTDNDKDTIRIAVLHHHLIPVPSEEPLDPEYPYGSISLTLDAGKVIEGLQYYNFDFVLHGHQHLPGLCKISRGQINNNKINIKKSLFILGAGSAGAKVARLTENLRDNSFSILFLDKEKLAIESVQYNTIREPNLLFESEIKIER